MSVIHRRSAHWVALLLMGAGLSACSSIDGASSRLTNAITPYKISIVQGNFVSKEQVAALQPGMPRSQVRDVLGTPLLASVFHADRWDYVFTLKRQGVEPQERRLSVFFKDGVLERFEGDDMPSEAEFVASLDVGKAKPKVPNLEASEESLRKFAPASGNASRVAATSGGANDGSGMPIPGANAGAYPPLESPGR